MTAIIGQIALWIAAGCGMFIGYLIGYINGWKTGYSDALDHERKIKKLKKDEK